MSSWEADLFALTYEDRMSVKRHIEKTDEETGISSFNESIPILDNIPCALSQKNEPTIGGDFPSIISTHRIFARPENDIKAGDLISVKRFSRVYEFVASEPFYYVSHVEIPVEKKERL
ncbi:hypothetical protein [Peptostreptococcus anaerobius]|uniref:hypothetical protein n=1 Tax=Peptostreptococcus anaerobius TaxID=1261 RepID=UPI00321BEFFA